MAAKYRITVNLSEFEYNELGAFSERNQVSLAWLGRMAIQEYLERHRQGELQLPLSLTTSKASEMK